MTSSFTEDHLDFGLPNHAPFFLGLPVITVWLQSSNDGSFRFITLKPKKD